jgi:hypothetical protein
MNNLLNAALDYVGRGWSINPLIAKDKIPLLNDGKKHAHLKNWDGTWFNYQNTLPNKGEINFWWKQWPDANVMIITGATSGIVVLDIDGPEGQETLAGFQDIYGMIPKTPAVSTGKGQHYYFRHPGFEIRNFARKAPGLDLRGDGGYVVAPPSIHPSGAVYKWLSGPDVPLADMPEWLLGLIRGEGQKRPKYEAKVKPDEILAGVSEGGRNQALFQYAARLRAQGIGQTEAEILVHQAGANCNPPLPEKEIDTIINSVWSRYPAGEQRQVKPVADMTQLEGLADRKDDILSPETIGALAVLKQDNTTEYARLKATLKGKVNLNDLERAVNQQIRDDRKLHVVDGPEEPALEDILPNLPMKNLIKPHDWTLNENGIWQQTKSGPCCACSVPVILTQRLRNVESGEEKIELAFYRDNVWRKVAADRATVFNRTSLIMLANKGLPVSSESAKNLVRYLADLERVNMQNLPLVKSTGHMGWCGSKFLPGAEGDVMLDAADGMGGLVGGYTQNGTLERWVENAEKVRGFPLARLVMSASFAAPLLRIVGQRIFIIHLWGNTTGGKSASTFTALSIWGDPEEIIGSFNATKVGLERMASFYCDLPLGIDEKQVAGDKQGFIESIVYLLGLGKGKARGAKGGGVQAFASWRTVVLTTGEEPLSSSSSTGGIKTRAMEIYGQPIPEKQVATDVYSWTQKYHGTAGVVWINKIIDAMAKDPNLFINDYKAFMNKLSGEHEENIKSHLSALALVAVADYYSSQWIFGMDKDTAYDQALAMVENIIALLETAADADDTGRAHDYLMSWYGVNEDYFSQKCNDFTQRQRWGFVRSGTVYIYPTIFEKALKDGGFNVNRVLRDFAEKGLIEIPPPEKDRRRRFKVKLMLQNQRGYFVGLKVSHG